MTDFFALPGDYAAVPYTDPNRSHTPSVPLDSSDGMGGVVQSDEADWRKRAKIAREGAEELREARDGLDGTLEVNYFGECTEGRNVYDMLRRTITDWRADLDQQARDLDDLAIRCENAARRYASADDSGARDFEA